MLIGGRMNYVQLHLGDWIAGTLDLTPTERGVYMDLLVRYYKEERPLMQDECKRIARGYAPAEQDAMHYVLQRFFTLENGEYRQSRCDEEIEKAQTVSNKRKRAAASRWAKKPEIDASAYPNAEQTQCECNANGMLTNNQQPITNINKVGGAFSEKVADAPEPPPSDFCDEIPEELFPEAWGALEPLPPPETKPAKKEKRGTRLDLKELPEPWERWAEEKAPDLDPKAAFEEFRNYWIAVPGAKGVKLDWFATFRNSVLSMPDWKRKTFRKKTEADKVKPASFEEIQAIIRGEKQLRKDENDGQA